MSHVVVACFFLLQVCGEGEGVIGDAVVPLRSMFLDGADNVELAGVFHSMSRVGTYDSPGGTVAPHQISLAWSHACSIACPPV